ncbi:3-isopropylmalate dehydratase large subunit [Frankliniella fusca]|uniref:3-isopropylmalate dehydratase large subunit n=1 Tax=Frankliniella fusca TaxID=407009 RepID=A0AAE1GRV7_9NEOP|nr:3-isopropylmalate dehydratase large subunit [Frankliniella fusca]
MVSARDPLRLLLVLLHLAGPLLSTPVVQQGNLLIRCPLIVVMVKEGTKKRPAADRDEHREHHMKVQKLTERDLQCLDKIYEDDESVDKSEEIVCDISDGSFDGILNECAGGSFYESKASEFDHEVGPIIVNASDEQGESSNFFEQSLNDFHDQDPRAKGAALNEKLRDFVVEHNVSHSVINGILKIFKPYHEFLPTDARTLLKTTRDISPIEKMGIGEFIYLGVRESLTKFLLIRLSLLQSSTIHLNVSIDGDSPFKSSKDQLWPILVKVDELPRSKPVLVAAWFGAGHPPVEQYLKKFIHELVSDVLINGICIKNKIFKVNLKNFICDAPATAMLKMTKYHSGFYGCGKCEVKGEKVGGCLVFTEIDKKLRTDFDFRNQVQIDHHKGTSPLCALPINLIDNFPLDYLHLILIGSLKRYLEVLIFGYVFDDGKPKYDIINGRVKKKQKRRKGKLSQKDITAINSAIQALKKFCPLEFSRICRILSDCGLWKATEYRQFLLYIGVVVLKGVIPKEHYELFLQLHAAIRILCSEDLCLKLGRVAEDLLKSFVKKSPKLCGENFPVYCIHNLVHVYQDVLKQGRPLDSFSAFPFESYHGILKNLLRGRARPLAQLYKRIQEKENKIDLNEEMSCAPTYSGIHEDGPNCALKGSQFKELTIGSFKFSTKHSKDSYAVLRNNSVVKILNIIKCENKLFVVGKYFSKCQDLYVKPIKSSMLGIQVVSGLSQLILSWPVDHIKTKAYLVLSFCIPPKGIIHDIYNDQYYTTIFNLFKKYCLENSLDAQFAVVEFPEEKEDGSAPMSVVPMSWIHAKGKRTFWPSKPRLTDSELESIVKAQRVPDKADGHWLTTNCKIMCTSRTYKGAEKRMARLQKETVVSSSQEDEHERNNSNVSNRNESSCNTINTSGASFLNNSVNSEDNESSSDDEPLVKRRKLNNLATPAHVSLNASKLPTKPKTDSKTPHRSGIKSGRDVLPLKTSTPHKADNFEGLVMRKLNEIYSVVEQILAQGNKRGRNVLTGNTVTNLEIPTSLIETVLALDVELGDPVKKKNMVNYLCQFGGKTSSDFLYRVMEKLFNDELCAKMNWTGLHREQAFKDCKHIVSTIHVATRSLFDGTTEAAVEKWLKLWFNKYKDRLFPRAHIKNQNAPQNADEGNTENVHD